MTIVRWYSQPQYPSLRRQLESMYNSIDRAALQSDKTHSGWQPAVAWQESEENYTLSIQLPGLTAEDIDVEATRNTISIKGEYTRHETENKIVYSEFNYGKFNRAFELPLPIENEQIQAEFKAGILTLTLPKVKSAINRVVKVDLTKNSNLETTAD